MQPNYSAASFLFTGKTLFAVIRLIVTAIGISAFVRDLLQQMFG